jgi:peptide/nickel transport system substrate-binding protein
MVHARRTRRGWRRSAQVVGLIAALALVATACGDDDDDSGATTDTTAAAATTAASTATTTAASSGGSTATTSAATTATTASAATPVAGGEATIELFSEIGTTDPVKSTGSGGSDAQRMFPLYGALVTYDSSTNKAEPLFADSFTSSADFMTWTLKLKSGNTFSDGTPYDAAAVKANWDRVADPANASPARGLAAAIASTTVTDPLTLTIALKAPNAYFPNSIARFGAMNYLASAKAIADKQDLTSKPVGAGPYTMQEWVRDDHMTLIKNPNYIIKPGPYLDKITLRVVGDEQQRLDTFTKGDADAAYTATAATVAAAKKAGGDFTGVAVGTGNSYVFNTAKPPFSDIRVRQAFIMALDLQDMDTSVFGEGSKAATTFSLPGSYWFDGTDTLPAHDPAKAQELFNEAAKDLGGTVTIELQGFQQALDQRRAEYIQTALQALDNVKVNVTINDSPTSIGNVLQNNYQVSSWGFPFTDPEPDLYNATHSGLPTNYSKYNNPAVDAALDTARKTADNAARLTQYKIVWQALAKDVPYFPYLLVTNGFITSKNLHGAKVYGDGILRFDLIWKSA